MGRLAQVMAGILLSCGLGCKGSPLDTGLPAEFNCSSCHGGPDNAAPPLALDGATSTSDIGVGAHQSHMTGGSISAPVACEECHPVPTLMNGDDHPDPLSRGTVMTFGPIAQSGGANPVWNRAAKTCTNTYCHGATLPGSFKPALPLWTKVDGSQIKCDSCHAILPDGLGGSHPLHSAYSCDTCHPRVVTPDLTINHRNLHVTGLTDVSMAAGDWDPTTRTCANTPDGCHGSIPW
jgi:predicted CxxxxCH...CXXCH cytochrome family protein